MSSTSEYTFTGPNGEVYKVTAPAGTSITDAQSAFNQQINSGGLQNLGIGQALGGLSGAASSALSAVKNLTNVAIPTTLDPATILKTTPVTTSIGSLDPKQVTGLVAQAGSLTKQAGNIAGVPTSGVGQYNLSPQQLEQQGYLKPGTAAQYCTGTTDYTKVLSSPTLWTGKGGAGDLSSFTSNPALQTSTLTNVMSTGLDQLKKLGVVTGAEAPAQLGAMLQSAATFGTAAVAAWTQGKAPPDIAGAIGGIAKSGQQALSLVDSLPNTAPTPEGATNTVDRSAVNSAVNSFVGNPKIPPATYGPVEREKVGPDPNQSAIDRYQAALDAYLAKIGEFYNRGQALGKDLEDLEASTITRPRWDAVNATLQGIRSDYNSQMTPLYREVESAFETLPSEVKKQNRPLFENALERQLIVAKYLKYLRDRIADDEQRIGA